MEVGRVTLSFEIATRKGQLVREYFETVDVNKITVGIEDEFKEEDYLIVKFHHCHHSKGQPCEDWETLIEREKFLAVDD